MKIKAIIPARSGSVRCKNKNIRDFNGETLLELKIKQLLRIPVLDGIIVNSNDDNILEIASKYDIECVKRDNHYATSTVSINDVYQNIAQNFDADIMVYCNCTNPFIKDETIMDCIKIYNDMDMSKNQSVNTAFKLKSFIWYNSKPLNYNYDKMPRSQDLPEYISPNFGVNVISKNYVIKYKQIISKNPFFYIIDNIEGFDIDDEIDFQISKNIYKEINYKNTFIK